MKKLFIPFLFIFIVLISCKSDDLEILEEKTVSYDVYVTGSENNTACYWKNGQKTNLPGGAGINPSKIIVENNHIYVFESSAFWKDGIKTDIRQYLTVPAALLLNIREFYVENDNVYLLGYVEDPNPAAPSQKYQFCYWKNGIKTVVATDPGEMVFNNSGYSMTVFQSTVYISGHQKINGTVSSGYFKSGVFYPVTQGYQSNSISSDNTAIYLSVNRFYKNLITGIETQLTPIPTGLNLITNKLLIDHNDIYRSGFSTYYKNAVEVPVTGPPFNGIADMKVLDGNIYMIRWSDGSLLNYKVFINDVETQMTSGNGRFNSIFVVKN